MRSLLLIPLSILIVLSACTKIQEQSLDSSKKQRLSSIKYSHYGRCYLDIVLPANRSNTTPVVIFIHGGAWVMGDKSVFETEINRFADAGIACATINYRYASDLSNVHHPDLTNDVLSAVEFISNQSDKWQIASDRFGLVGHSAGGHLAFITGTAFNNGKIKAIVSWAGPVDFTDSEQLNIAGAKEVFKTYIGTALENSSDTLLYRSASPYWMIQNNTVPTLLIYGDKDDGVPYNNAIKTHQKLQSFNVQTQLITLSDQGHIWIGDALETARNASLNWFLQNL